MARIPPTLLRLLILSLLLIIPTLLFLRPSNFDNYVQVDHNKQLSPLQDIQDDRFGGEDVRVGLAEVGGKVDVVGIGHGAVEDEGNDVQVPVVQVVADKEREKEKQEQGKVKVVPLEDDGVDVGVGIGGAQTVVWQSGVVMGKMENATAKAELGRATWKLLHTMAQRFPKTPTTSERQTFIEFFHIFSKMYPCGECAEHFQSLLSQFPPQTSSRDKAALWLCFLHNQVNLSLDKEEFDCNDLEGKYDCGCGEEESKSTSVTDEISTTITSSTIKATSTSEDDVEIPEETSNKMVVLAKPGTQALQAESVEGSDEAEEEDVLWANDPQEG